MQPIALEDIQSARERIRAIALRTPLIRLQTDESPAEIYLKLENLQPIGSFKLRGAGNAMALMSREALAHGVVTASAGNMAQGVAWNARRLGIPCRVIVPDHAPETKLEAIRRLGGDIVKTPFDRWWNIILSGSCDLPGAFIHPVSHPAVIAGNGTIGIEILDDLPDVDAVIIPYGGGGLSCGIATALRALKPKTRIYAVEVETAAPLAASLKAGDPLQWTIGRASSMASAAKAFCRKCGTWRGGCWTDRWSCRWMKWRRRFGCWLRVNGSSRKARARLLWRRLWRAGQALAKPYASSQAAISIWLSWRGFYLKTGRDPA